jgi:predicted alpha/beta superfamily hydrolase
MKKTALFFFLLLHAVTVFSQEKIVTASLPKVEINGSQLLELHSNIVNQDYVLHVFAPGSYKNTTKKYPVLYVMDSQWDFPLLVSLYGQQYYDGFIPELTIVGITWGGKNANADSLRARDYTPTKEARLPQSGGAANFLSFMKNELFPFVETQFRIDPAERGLMGCSLGGLFTLYALFTEPTLFKRYIAASPAFGWDKEVINHYESAYHDKKINSPAKLYMSMGGVERGVPGFQRLEKRLSERNYPQLAIKTRILENTGHSGTKAEGYTRGLQYVFERPTVRLSAALVDKYAGRYQAADGSTIELKREGDGLAVYFGAGNRYVLYAANETELYADSELLNIRMSTEAGKVKGFTLERFGGEQWVKKI